MSDVKPEILAQYQREDEFVLINEHDPDLMTIRVNLPSLTDWYAAYLGREVSWEEAITFVDGYGKAAEDQRFEKQKMPLKLREIVGVIKRKKTKDVASARKYRVSTTDIYEEIEDNRVYYKDEVEYIKRDILRRYVGYWCFINGKPTFIDGWHYFYLNYWDIANSGDPDGLPEYRDVDRRFTHFVRYCYTTTEAYYQYRVQYNDFGGVKDLYFSTLGEAEKAAEKLKEKGFSSVIEGGGSIDGERPHPGFVVDKGRRTCYGYVHPKRRRRGATSLAACIGYLVTIERRLGHMGVQSLNDDMATKDVYLDKIIRPWRKLPFWHKPASEGSDTPKERLLFQHPADRKNLSFNSKKEAHDGWIEPRHSGERAFDGLKMLVLIRDEGGKIDTSVYDLVLWWEVHKKTLAQGFNVHGLAMIPSTVGEMDSGGGRQYERLINMSKFEMRDGNGQTTSGLFTIMEASFDGLDGYIDFYGNSVIEDPEKPVLSVDGKTWIKEGAKRALQNSRDQKLRNASQEDYIAELRDFPFTLREALTKGTRNSGFDVKILSQREKEIRFSRTPENYIKPRRVSMRWMTDFGGAVEVYDDSDGKFLLSQLPPHDHRNRVVFDVNTQQHYPDPVFCTRFIVGADPFVFDAQDVKGKKKSNGAIAILRYRDNVEDGDEKPRSQWSSEKFVLTYSQRVEDKNEYAEDCLMACILYSSFIYPEMNVPLVADKFREWGFGGFLLHDTDEFGSPSAMPGRKVHGGGTKNEIFSEVMTHIKYNGRWENHIELIEEWRDINGPDDMTNYDLFAASGMCFLGRKSQYPTAYKDNHTGQGLDENPFDVFTR
jgi:hypothetical protein